MIEYLKTAIQSVLANKARNILAILGVVIGVTAVTVLISLSQGLKNNVSSMIQGLGTNVLTAIGGNLDTKDINNSNPAQLISTDILNQKDMETIQKVPGVKEVAPMSLVDSNLKKDTKISKAMIVGVTPNFLEIVKNLKIEQGKMFDNRAKSKVVILSYDVRQSLFGTDEALEKKVKINGQEFLVLGIFAKPKTQNIFDSDFTNIAIIPFDTAKEINKDKDKIFRIIIKAHDSANVYMVKNKIREALLKNHKDENFTVLTQDDILNVFNGFLGLATALVSAIAAISLIVGGIGIMNVMLVTVTERTKEIGLRKSVGATSLAIAIQFLVESIIITLLGGIIGLVLAFLINTVIAAATPLKPVILFSTVLMAVGISLLVGVIFGLWPALNAAKKDPIEALRYE